MEEIRSRGIYLVANRKSSEHCHNLIYSIRQCGCHLPIRIVPYGGEPLRLQHGFEDVALLGEASGLASVGRLLRRGRNKVDRMRKGGV